MKGSVHKAALAGLLLASPVGAADLDQLFAGLDACQFDFFYYDEPARNPSHSFFSERGLKPYKERDGLYHFHVQEQLFGLPVVELVVPGTQDFHMAVFDVPATEAKPVLTARFGIDFALSVPALAGEAPSLVADPRDPGRSFVYCVERQGGY